MVTIGAIILIIGLVIILMGLLANFQEAKVEWGFGGFLGPIPFGAASSKGMFYLVIALSLVMFFVWYLLNK